MQIHIFDDYCNFNVANPRKQWLLPSLPSRNKVMFSRVSLPFICHSVVEEVGSGSSCDHCPAGTRVPTHIPDTAPMHQKNQTWHLCTSDTKHGTYAPQIHNMAPMHPRYQTWHLAPQMKNMAPMHPRCQT